MFPTIQALERLALQRGAVGFDYDKNRAGDIDWYRFRYAFEGVEPMVSMQESAQLPEPDQNVVEPLPIHNDVWGSELGLELLTLSEPDSDVRPDLVSALVPVPGSAPFASIPQSMKVLRRWSVWRKVSVKGKKGKVAYEVLPHSLWLPSHKCHSDKPSMWVSFEEALECYMKADGDLNGLSFTLGDGWGGADFDNVIVDGKLHPWVKKWLDALGSYDEISQSNTGIKSIFHGRLSENFLAITNATTGRQFKGIPEKGMVTEVYDKGRFFFMTGNGSGEPSDSQSVFDALCVELQRLKEVQQSKGKKRNRSDRKKHKGVSGSVDVSDHVVLDRIRRSRQGSKFDSLWAGGIAGYASASEADMALTSILMYWCRNDKVQVERLFSQSGLAIRDKWDREDYRVRTLAKAEQYTSETYEWRETDLAMDWLRKRSRSAKGGGHSG